MATVLAPALESAPQQSLMLVIERLASNPNVDIDKIKQLLEMQERWEVNRDKSAMRHAMAEFKKHPPQILKERIAKVTMKDDKGEFQYSYADLEACTSAIEGGLADHGITHGWKITENGSNISVTCILRYGSYEEIGAPLTAGPDSSGFKNPIQQKASTITYLERYTLLAAVGMAAGMPDSDANGEKATQMDEGYYAGHLTLIQGSQSLVELKTYYLAAVKAAKAAKDVGAERDFTRAKDERKATLEANNAGH